MNISDRIGLLRKAKGISQEELADKIGVSRQAVSKWESEQSIPDIDKIIILSDYFDVTTDYILKGIESPNIENKEKNSEIGVIVASALNLIGAIISWAIWYEKQTMYAIIIGLVFIVLGCMVYLISSLDARGRIKEKISYNFWCFNIWILSFIPLSFIYNIIFAGQMAPYPLLCQPIIMYPVFFVIYITFCVSVVLILTKKRKSKVTFNTK